MHRAITQLLLYLYQVRLLFLSAISENSCQIIHYNKNFDLSPCHIEEIKKTIERKNRAFNHECELQYFVVSRNGKMQCLLCKTVIYKQ